MSFKELGLKTQKQGLKIQKQGLKVERTNDIPEKHEVAISEVQGREAGVEKSKAGVESSRTNEDNEVDIGEVQVRKVWFGRFGLVCQLCQLLKTVASFDSCYKLLAATPQLHYNINIA